MRPFHRSLKVFSFTLGLGAMSMACVPDLYLIDRQTVLELEASGRWPELDEKYRAGTLTPGPLPFAETSDSLDKRELYKMTHADKEEPKPKVEKP